MLFPGKKSNNSIGATSKLQMWQFTVFIADNISNKFLNGRCFPSIFLKMMALYNFKPKLLDKDTICMQTVFITQDDKTILASHKT